MKTRIVKKNNKELVARKGSGFRGRVLAVQFGDCYIVLNNIAKKPRTEAVIRYCDLELTDEHISTLQRLQVRTAEAAFAYRTGWLRARWQALRQDAAANRQPKRNNF